jgi:hypothetical protein
MSEEKDLGREGDIWERKKWDVKVHGGGWM